MVGFAHQFTAAEWGAVSDVMEGKQAPSFFSSAAQNVSEEELEGNWKLDDGGVRPAFVHEMLQSLVGVVPSLSTSAGEEKEMLSDVCIVENERVKLRPAWDGMRIVLRGSAIVEVDGKPLP